MGSVTCASTMRNTCTNTCTYTVQHIDAKVFREMRGFTVCVGHLCACGHVWYQEGAHIGIGNSNHMSSLIAG